MASALTFIVNSSSPAGWLLCPAIGALAGVYCFYQGFQLLQRKRLILNTPASRIRSAPMGLVELSGLAIGPCALVAPITGVPCFYYRTKVWQWKRQGKNSSWEEVVDESLHVPFYLEDNTGRVLVNPQGAEMEIHRDFQDEFSQSLFSSSLGIPTNISRFLAMHGVSFDQKIKIEEYCIRPKNSLFILGTLGDNPGIEVNDTPVRSTPTSQRSFSFRMPLSLGGSLLETSAATTTFSPTSFQRIGGQAENIHQSSKSNAPLDPAKQQEIAAVLTKAGITAPAAWEAAGLGGSNNSVTAAAPATGFDLHPHVVLLKGKHNPAFFISWRSQREVVKSLGWKSALMIWGGPALTLVCAYVLAGQFGWL